LCSSCARRVRRCGTRLDKQNLLNVPLTAVAESTRKRGTASAAPAELSQRVCSGRRRAEMAAMNMEERMALMGIGDLSDQIKPSACYGLNISAQKPIVNLFQGDERLVCQSAEDEQMIINIPFSEAVMIHSINISAMEGEEAPEDIKLFTNMPSLGFSDCDDGPCAAKLTLTAEDLLADRVCELKMAKFNYVNVLSIFVDTNNGADVTSISSIKINGKTRESTNMANFKKVG
jgi:hypothetical protein